MCTAFSVMIDDHYFGRNLDLDYHYNEEITVTPRGYPFSFRYANQPNAHYAMMCTKHKFFDSPAVLWPSYREVSRYSTNSVLNTQQ